MEQLEIYIDNNNDDDEVKNLILLKLFCRCCWRINNYSTIENIYTRLYCQRGVGGAKKFKHSFFLLSNFTIDRRRCKLIYSRIPPDESFQFHSNSPCRVFDLHFWHAHFNAHNREFDSQCQKRFAEGLLSISTFKVTLFSSIREMPTRWGLSFSITRRLANASRVIKAEICVEMEIYILKNSIGDERQINIVLNRFPSTRLLPSTGLVVLGDAGAKRKVKTEEKLKIVFSAFIYIIISSLDIIPLFQFSDK